jgi:uncharacterized membrane protein YcfT
LSLVAGFAGAGAVVVGATLLSGIGGMQWLRYCGRNSILVYLGFFLPMAATRTAIVSTGVVRDIGLAAALVIFAGVIGPLLPHALGRNTRLNVLFVRPPLFHLADKVLADKAPAGGVRLRVAFAVPEA